MPGLFFIHLVYDFAMDSVVHGRRFYHGQTCVGSCFPGTGTDRSQPVYANSLMACLNARSLFPEREASQFDTAMFSSVPDVSVQSNGSILPSFAPTPHNGTRRPVSVSRPSSHYVPHIRLTIAQRPASLPDLVFCKNGQKAGIIATTSLAPGGVCPCMLATRP